MRFVALIVASLIGLTAGKDGWVSKTLLQKIYKKILLTLPKLRKNMAITGNSDPMQSSPMQTLGHHEANASNASNGTNEAAGAPASYEASSSSRATTTHETHGAIPMAVAESQPSQRTEIVFHLS